jgi:hypothetical protein
LCAQRLRELNYRVEEQRFGYSAFPGRVATPLAGVVLILAFAGIPHAAVRELTGMALAWYVATLVSLALLLAAGLNGRVVLRFPLTRRESINLVARAGSDPPVLWLMAHLDSKSQPVSIMVRAAAIVAAAVLLVAMGVLLAFATRGVTTPFTVWAMVALLGCAASVPIALSVVGNSSAGAVDNASGVASVLDAAALLDAAERERVGLILTSAEELGLAGAHHWAAHAPQGMAINCDSIDDVGTFLCVGGDSRVGAALGEAAAQSETEMVTRRRLGGILVDATALARKGWDCATLCRGNMATLRRIHTEADTAGWCTGRGVPVAAALIAAAARRLTSRAQPSC